VHPRPGDVADTGMGALPELPQACSCCCARCGDKAAAACCCPSSRRVRLTMRTWTARCEGRWMGQQHRMAPGGRRWQNQPAPAALVQKYWRLVQVRSRQAATVAVHLVLPGTYVAALERQHSRSIEEGRLSRQTERNILVSIHVRHLGNPVQVYSTYRNPYRTQRPPAAVPVL
jgi:hypothetical protein